MKFDIQIPPEAQALVQRLRDKPGLSARLARNMDQQNLLTIARIQRAYMSFPKDEPATPDGTRVQSNRLRNSARASKTLITLNGLVSTLGSNVAYAAVQEFGFHGTVTVPAHARTMTRGKGKKRTTTVVAVKSYAMKMDLPAREMFQKGIKDRIGEYGPSLLETMLQFEAGN